PENDVTPEQPASDDARLDELRHALVETLQRRGIVTDARVAEAFEAVPRHRFVPGVEPERAYSDASIATRRHGDVTISSSSQPAIMALMLQQLQLEPACACWRSARAPATTPPCSATWSGRTGG